MTIHWKPGKLIKQLRNSKIIPNSIFYLVATKYREESISDLVKCGCYAEALTELNIGITNKLKFLFLKHTKGLNKISLDYKSQNYNIALKLVKQMSTYEVIRFAYVFRRIDVGDCNSLTGWNNMRNIFDHQFNEREGLKENQMEKALEKGMGIQRKLSKNVDEDRTICETLIMYINCRKFEKILLDLNLPPQ